MKRLLFTISLIWVLSLNVFTQNVKYTSEYNEKYRGTYAQYQDMEATMMLYKETNLYRNRMGVEPAQVNPITVNFACRWGNYMVSQTKDPWDVYYKHASYGPTEYHIPKYCSENIHCLYYPYKPSAMEIVHTLMYGEVRYDGRTVIGWTQSPGHNENILDARSDYIGASIYVIKIKDSWMVFSVVNFSLFIR